MDFKYVRENEEKSILEKQKKVDSDFWRQKYHIQGIVGLINDPNGFSQFNEKYHMFYQWNPLKTDHTAKYWAHSTSVDLLHWKREKTALRPETEYTKNGVYSGSALIIDEKLYLFYTGNVKDDEGNRSSYQCIAISQDGKNFKRIEPVIINQPDGYTRHIRDPKVWEKDGTYYMVLGIQSSDLKGKTVLYSSENIYDWKFEGEIAGAYKGKLKEFGFMWECPDYFQLKDEKTDKMTDILLFSPQGLKPEGDLYNNKYQSGYFLGKLNYEKPEFIIESDFIEIDRGHDFYAPQTMVDNKGRRLIIGWMGVPEEEDYPTIENEWLHCLTLPRQLKFMDGKLYQLPIEEMNTIRGEKTEFLSEVKGEREVGKGLIYELKAEFTNIGSNFGLKLRVGKNCETVLRFDYNEKKFTLDRSHNRQSDKSLRKVYLGDIDKLELTVFVDNSSIEIFINNGKEVFSSRIFPDKDGNGITVFSENSINAKIEKWEWK
ncbi:sucrose-6-phosphate hydrolase [Leptotrichia sp. OH3620_COT-345]|uniref:sucrose-6-phosphate hydrolase n=1 Tax=Leptotrichia sp. OH3620_COT-345 TaxID=2491048 RepID=UPI000F653710|nr:sucrose-6-phosphate hydrolase [Leptotrichia sp. OH3620_COT-345]RRD40935.1 sucrose-6-phosphate hydrolase [Leptotrichia sp. OH3620_COT-345]